MYALRLNFGCYYIVWNKMHSANLQPAAYVANTKFLSVFSWEAA